MDDQKPLTLENFAVSDDSAAGAFMLFVIDIQEFHGTVPPVLEKGELPKHRKLPRCVRMP